MISDTPGFNEKLAKESAEAFYSATGIPCTLIDNSGTSLYSCGSGCADCKLCEEIEKITGNRIARGDFQSYGLVQAERFGGKYIYFCPMGLTCFISPIMDDDSCIAAFAAGPLLMVDSSDFLEYDLMEKMSIPTGYREHFTHLVSLIPDVTPEKVNSFSTILFNQAAFISSTIEEKKIIKNKESQELQGQIGHYLMSIKGAAEDAPPYPFEKERELSEFIINCDKQNSQRVLNELLGYIFLYSGGDFPMIRSRMLELIVLISRAAVDGGADSLDIFALNNRCLSDIYSFTNVDDLCLWLASILNKFTDYAFNFKDVKHLDIIHKSLEYMRHKYREKISLDTVSEYVYLSPSYFSKIFKEEMKCNFNTYLNRLRIDKAKQLLLSENVKLIDVAGLVGFEDQSYFSKVFKKHTGVTPGYFREKRGKIRIPKT